jgi:hypothetical protein
MSIFSAIRDKIFGVSKAAAAPATTGGVDAPASTSTPAPALAEVDVVAILDNLNASAKEKLNWRVSIVDLMKLLDLDSSLTARKELAKELAYAGDTHDSATMNIWLHKQVMAKLAQNGGKVPDDLRS